MSDCEKGLTIVKHCTTSFPVCHSLRRALFSEAHEVMKAVRARLVDVLFVSPERLDPPCLARQLGMKWSPSFEFHHGSCVLPQNGLARQSDCSEIHNSWKKWC